MLPDQADDSSHQDLRAVGDRIETLLEASSTGGTLARERAEEIVRLVSGLYGGGLQRMMEILDEQKLLTDSALDAFCRDDLVASLLMVHGLHPDDVTARVERALDSVRPYLESHGGNVELLGVGDDAVVHLRLLGSCDGCGSSAATMSLAVEDAVTRAAPEITGFEVESHQPTASAGRGLIPLTVVPHAASDSPPPAESTGWHEIAGVDGLAVGDVLGLIVAGVPIVLCRNGSDLLAFRDGCARCGSGLGSAQLERRLGGSSSNAVLVCPACRAHFDVRLAGAGLDTEVHLEPLPLLRRADLVEVALPGSAHLLASSLPAATLRS